MADELQDVFQKFQQYIQPPQGQMPYSHVLSDNTGSLESAWPIVEHALNFTPVGGPLQILKSIIDPNSIPKFDRLQGMVPIGPPGSAAPTREVSDTEAAALAGEHYPQLQKLAASHVASRKLPKDQVDDVTNDLYLNSIPLAKRYLATPQDKPFEHYLNYSLSRRLQGTKQDINDPLANAQDLLNPETGNIRSSVEVTPIQAPERAKVDSTIQPETPKPNLDSLTSKLIDPIKRYIVNGIKNEIPIKDLAKNLGMTPAKVQSKLDEASAQMRGVVQTGKDPEAALHEGLAGIKSRTIRDVLLRNFKGISERDTGTALGISQRQVRQLLNAGQQNLISKGIKLPPFSGGGK
jgi:hypothetical protein